MVGVFFDVVVYVLDGVCAFVEFPLIVVALDVVETVEDFVVFDVVSAVVAFF